MTRPFLSTLAAAAVLLAAAPVLADPSTPASTSTPAAAPAAAAPVAATPPAAAPAAATCEPMAKKIQELEARLRQSEATVAELVRDRAPTPPDSHAESY